MLRLKTFPLEEAPEITKLRLRTENGDSAGRIAFGVALSALGCTYEAAHVLRPLRTEWKSLPEAGQAKIALEAQGWWNKNWREFAQLKQAGKREEALKLLGERAVLYWDLPPLLVHLADIAADDGELDLADHLYQRVFYLAERGLPKMNMAAFIYVSQAGRVEVLRRKGEARKAIEVYKSITPNQGNAMAHEIQHVRLLVAAGDLDEAMKKAAALVVTAEQHRSGYSRDIRMDFIRKEPELDILRKRADWERMLEDPKKYVQG